MENFTISVVILLIILIILIPVFILVIMMQIINLEKEIRKSNKIKIDLLIELKDINKKINKN